jgi:hypothetical protein
MDSHASSGICSGQRTSKCVLSRAILLLNSIFTLLLFYQLLVVYIIRREKRFTPCCSDIRLWILLMALLNGVIVHVYLMEIKLPQDEIMPGFMALEMLRFLVLISMCLLYSSAASKNLITHRKRIMSLLIISCVTASIVMVEFGIQINRKMKSD